MKVTVQFEGGQELAAALDTLSTTLSRKIQREALKEAGEPMRAEWARLAPRDDEAPHAADTIRIGNARGVDEQDVTVAVGPTKAGFYLSFQEFGTSRHSAQPSGRPAFDAHVGRVLAAFGRAAWRELAARGVSKSRVGGGSVRSGPGGRGL